MLVQHSDYVLNHMQHLMKTTNIFEEGEFALQGKLIVLLD